MPRVAVKGDTTTTGHGCDGTTTIATSTIAEAAKVKVNGIIVAIKGNPLAGHTIPNTAIPPVCIPHPGTKVNVGSANVLVNNIPIARVGDSADGGAIINNSRNVFAGG